MIYAPEQIKEHSARTFRSTWDSYQAVANNQADIFHLSSPEYTERESNDVHSETVPSAGWVAEMENNFQSTLSTGKNARMEIKFIY